MAKYRRYRNYNRRRGRWSSNIFELGTTTITVPNQVAAWSQNYTLAYNPVQTNTATSQTYTAKNVEVTFELSGGDGSIEDVTAYIMFVPQGMQVTTSYNIEHPEYVMAYRFLGSPINDTGLTSQALAPKVRTRLSRRLNTGDSIILFIKGNKTSAAGTTTTLEFHGLARWWTKAN